MTDAMKVLVHADMRYIDLFEIPEDPPDSREVISGLRSRLKAMGEDK